MSKFDKFKEVVGAASSISKPLVPGGVGKVLDMVSAGLDNQSDPKNEQTIKDMAAHMEEQDKAILALHERVKRLEGK